MTEIKKGTADAVAQLFWQNWRNDYTKYDKNLADPLLRNRERILQLQYNLDNRKRNIV